MPDIFTGFEVVKKCVVSLSLLAANIGSIRILVGVFYAPDGHFICLIFRKSNR